VSTFTQNGSGSVVIDAENGVFTAGDLYFWKTTTLDGRTVVKPTGSSWTEENQGTLTYKVEITTADIFTLLMRCDARSEDSNADGKVRVKINGNTGFGIGNRGIFYYTHNDGLRWSDSNTNAQGIALGVGTHTLTLTGLRKELCIDRIALVSGSQIQDGDTGVGPAETLQGVVTESDPPYTYENWLSDLTRRGYRTRLYEIEHAEGTLRFATRAYMDELGNPYNDFIQNGAVMETNADALATLGSFTFFYPKTDINPIDLDVHGYTCTIYSGDITWEKGEFKKLLTTTITAIEQIGHLTFQVNLETPASKLDVRYYTGVDTSFQGTAEAAIAYINGLAPGIGTVSFRNLNQEDLAIEVDFAVTENSNAYTDLKEIAFSIGAKLVSSTTGEITMLKVDRVEGPELTEFEVIEDEITTTDTLYPVKNVVLTYAQGASSVSGTTTARTGTLNATAEYSSYLRYEADALNRLASLVALRTKARRTWAINLARYLEFITVGDYMQVSHPMLTGAGEIVLVRDEPENDRIGYVEILI